MHSFIHSIALTVSRLMTRCHTASTAEAPGSLASESFQPTRFANMSLFFPSNKTGAPQHPSRSIPRNLPFRPARSTGTISTAIGNAARRGAVGLLLALAALAFLPTAALAQTAPSRPRPVTAGEGNGQIVLQWAEPKEDGGSAITGYEFRRRFSNGGDWQTIPGGGVARSHTVTDLTNGQVHGFHLRARNENGPGDQASAAGMPHAGAPGPPTNLTVTFVNINFAAGPKSARQISPVETYSPRQISAAGPDVPHSLRYIKLNWTAPTVGPGVTITGYDLVTAEQFYTQEGGWVLAAGQTEFFFNTPNEPVTRCYRLRVFFLSAAGQGASAYTGVACGSNTRVYDEEDETLLVAVSPAWATEGVDDTIDFPVYLIREAEEQVQVSYRTADVTARAGEHYVEKTGTLVFEPGEQLKWISVALVDDLVNDPWKLFTLNIYDVFGGVAVILHGVAAGNITNSETYPVAGFTLVDAATQAVLAVLPDGGSVTLDDPSGGSFAIRAVAPPDAEIGSVRLELSGAKAAVRTVNAAPWSLFGGGGEPLPAGAYTLTATVYSEADLGGDVLQTLRVSFTVVAATPSPPTGGGGGGGGPRTSAPDATRNLLADGGDGAVTLAWDAPEDDGGAAITDYQYRINGRNPWISTGTTDTTHTVTGLVNGTAYVFEVRAVNRIGRSQASLPAEATPRAAVALDFAHFANGTGIASDFVFVNVSTHMTRPALYFYDQGGDLMDPASVVDLTGDLVVAEDGSLTVHKEMEPLGQLTISTHGRGELVSGSVKVVSDGPIGGVLRFDHPTLGVAGVGASPPVRDVLFPARRQEGGIRTAAALHNLGEEAVGVNCQLMSGGVALEEVEIALAANGQASWFIDEAFPTTDTSDFLGSVRCTVPGSRRFTAIAVETDAAQRIFTTLPVVAVDRTGGSGGETVLDFAHFANGTWITDLVFLNLSIQPSGPALSPFHTAILPSRPAIYFYDTAGNPIAPASLVDLTDDLEVTEDGALTINSEMEPLEALTISTHGRGELVTGSVKVVSDGPIGGMLRFDHPDLGVAGVEASPPVSDAIFPVRRQEGGTNTGVALHNLQSSSGLVRCELLREGVLLDSVSIPLETNGQTSWLINQAFPGTDTSDFAGSVRCSATGGDLFTAVALEMDSGSRTFTTLPVAPVP